MLVYYIYIYIIIIIIIVIIIIIIIIYSFRVFHISVNWCFFTRVCVTPSLLKCPELFSVFWPFSVVWKVSTRPLTSKSSRLFNNPLVTVSKAPITIGIIVTFMSHSFFNSLARSRYLSFFSHSFNFIPWSAGTAKSTILQVLCFLWIYYYYLLRVFFGMLCKFPQLNMLLWKKKTHYFVADPRMITAQSAAVVEYTDSISAECPVYDTERSDGVAPVMIELWRISCIVTRWVAFVSVDVGVGASQRIPLSVLARNPHKRLAREISHKTGRRRGKEYPRVSQEKRTDQGGRQKRIEQGSRRKSGEADGRKRRLLGCVDQGPGWPTWEDESAFLVTLWEFRPNTHSR